MTIEATLEKCEKFLSDHNKEFVALESRVIVGHVLKKSNSDLLRDRETDLDSYQEAEVLRLMRERVSGKPLAYLIGHREFYGLSFTVNQNVLVPRQETELIIETVLDSISDDYGLIKIVDVGTGSGCIAVALAVSLKNAKISAIDISNEALSVARQNCRYHLVENRVDLIQGDILRNFFGLADAIVANLPYIKSDEIQYLSSEVLSEPKLALDGDHDGLRFQRKFLKQSKTRLKKSGFLAMEMDPQQSATLEIIAKAIFPDKTVTSITDASWHSRVLFVK